MINFDSLSLKALISEIEPILTEGRVQKVQQPSKHELLLTVRALRQTHKLYICVDPKYPHVALLSTEGEKLRDIGIPQKPPMFCMLLRKHMEGAKINAVEQPNFERILEIKFDSYNELGERTPMILSCEFMGKHGNIILYSYETNVIQGCAHSVSHEKSRERELAGGLPYIYPPKQNKYDLTKISKEKFFELAKIMDAPVNVWLNEKFGFISKALATEFCNFLEIEIDMYRHCEQSEAIQKSTVDKWIASSQAPRNDRKMNQLYDLMISTTNFDNINPSISEDKKYYSIIGLDKSIKWRPVDSANSMIDLYFGNQVFNDRFSRLKNYLSGIIKKEIKKRVAFFATLPAKNATLLAKNAGETAKNIPENRPVEKVEKQEKYRQYADLIMTNLYKITQGAEYAEFENFFDENKIIKIPLDKMLSPNANAQKYYKLYNKAKSAAMHGRELAEKIRQEVDYLETIRESINLAENLVDLKEIEQELISQNLIKSSNYQGSKKEKKETIKLTEFISSEGFSILVGKNNRQNEFLLKIANPEDIWLHTLNIPGSHVLIKMPQNTDEVSETTLHEAIYLAAYYSQARESSNVSVVYTRKKFVKKPQGSKPGFVIFTREKTLVVNPDREKLPSKQVH